MNFNFYSNINLSQQLSANQPGQQRLCFPNQGQSYNTQEKQGSLFHDFAINKLYSADKQIDIETIPDGPNNCQNARDQPLRDLNFLLNQSTCLDMSIQMQKPEHQQLLDIETRLDSIQLGDIVTRNDDFMTSGEKHHQQDEQGRRNTNQYNQQLTALLRQEETKFDDVGNIQAQLVEKFPGWMIVKELGKGAHGAVYKIKNDEDHIYVLKVFSKKLEKDFIKEVSILKILGMSSLPRIDFDSFSFELKDYFCFVLEAGFATLSQLKAFLRLQDERLSERDLMSILYALYRCSKAFDGAGICHRDIKPANIVLHPPGDDGELDLQPIDYSIAVQYNEFTKSTAFGGTPGYIAPHISYNYENKIAYSREELKWGDLFSIGVIVLEFANTQFRPTQRNIVASIEQELLNLTNKECLFQALKMILLDTDKNLQVLDNLILEYVRTNMPEYTQPKMLFNLHIPTGLQRFFEKFRRFIGETTQEEVNEALDVRYDRNWNKSVDSWEEIEKESLRPISTIEILQSAEQFEKTGQIGMVLKDYCHLVRTYIKNTSHPDGSDPCQKILNILEHISNPPPLLLSTLAVQLCHEKKLAEAKEVLEEGLKRVSPDSKWVALILLNNLGCLVHYCSNGQAQQNEYFDQIHQLLRDDISLNSERIVEAWLSLTGPYWARQYKSPRQKGDIRFKIELEDLLLVTSPQVLTPFDYMDPRTDVRGDLTAVMFFNFSCSKALIIDTTIAQTKELSILQERLEEFCFYFNHDCTRMLERILALPGRQDFFYYLFKFTIILLHEERLGGSDNSVIQEAREIFNNREVLCESFKNLKTCKLFLEQLSTSEIFILMVGFPICQFGRTSNREWTRKELQLNRVIVLSHATNTIQLEDNRILRQFNKETTEHEISKDPMLDLIRQEQADQLLLENIYTDDQSGSMYSDIRKYGVIWNNEVSADQQYWFVYSVSMSIDDFTLDGSKQEIIDRNFSKLPHIRAFHLDFSHIQRHETHFTISMLSQLHHLQLTHLDLSFRCSKGLEAYSIGILAEFIASQHSLELLDLSHKRVSFNLEKTQILGRVISKMKQLKRINLIFGQCPDLTDLMVKGLFHEIDNMPMLDTLILCFESCEKIINKTREDLKNIAQTKTFPSLKDFEIHADESYMYKKK